ncbi:MAG: DUF5691 domain-containing protein [Cyanobacteria bacterium J06560_2]
MGQKPIQKAAQKTTWWQGLVGTALVGTDRQQPTTSPRNTPLEQCVNQLDWAEPEVAMLKAAGMVSVHQQIGYCPFTDIQFIELEDIELAEADKKIACSPQLAKHLAWGLNAYPQAVEELLSLIASTQTRIPYRLLPALLRYGVQHSEAQTLLEAVIDSRGRWLAAQNQDWHYVSRQPGESEEKAIARWQTQWQLGNRQQRMLSIEQWRRVDPNGAREAIAATWSSESRQVRGEAIALFHTHLSMADEPFLEAALSDRTQAIRQTSAQWLAMLPESRLCQRMSERAQQFIQIQHNEVSITWPDTFEASWAKDGIKKQTAEGLGIEASWLLQILSQTPLNLWTIDLSGSAHSWKLSVSTQQRKKVMLAGWAQAVCNQRQYEYARAWVPFLLPQLSATDWDRDILSTLLSLLPPQRKEQYLREQVPKSTNDQSSAHWLKLVAECDQKWDYDFSRLILSQLLQVLKSKYRYGDLFSPPGSLALSMHPGIATEAAREAESFSQTQRLPKSWRRFLDEFLGLLNYRWQMYQLFANSE